MRGLSILVATIVALSSNALAAPAPADTTTNSIGFVSPATTTTTTSKAATSTTLTTTVKTTTTTPPTTSKPTTTVAGSTCTGCPTVTSTVSYHPCAYDPSCTAVACPALALLELFPCCCKSATLKTVTETFTCPGCCTIPTATSYTGCPTTTTTTTTQTDTFSLGTASRTVVTYRK